MRFVPGAVRVLAAATLVLGAANASAQTFTTYDGFGAAVINPDRWLWPERQRQVVGGALIMTQRDYGVQLGDQGLVADSWSVSIRRNAAAVTQIRANVAVSEYQVTGCSANSEPSDVQARLVGRFFNAGTAQPTSGLDDVVAVARLIRRSDSTDATGVVRVQGVVVRCLDGECNTNVGVVGSVDLGTATLGTNVLLSMEWDRANKRFAFQRGTGAKKYVSYTFSDALPAYDNARVIGTRTRLANCFSGPKTRGYVKARFDNVAVNQSALN